MGATGYTEVDFGAPPGDGQASVAVAGQAGIVAGSFVEAWIFPKDTADHTVDEHLVDAPRVVAANIVPGMGFTIFAIATGEQGSVLHGKWSVAWVWA